jgi:hypothetical protein
MMMIIILKINDRNMIKKVTEIIVEYKDLTTEIQRMWIPVNNRGNLNHLKMIQTTPEQRTGRP